mgnify:CR=1 FL=1
MDSLLSRKTPRSRTTSEGLMEQSGPRLRRRWSWSELGLEWWSNQMSSVLVAFNLRRMDAHQVWISVKQATRRDFAFCIFNVLGGITDVVGITIGITDVVASGFRYKQILLN